MHIGRTYKDGNGDNWLGTAQGKLDGPADREAFGAGSAMRMLVRESRTNNAFDAEKFRRRLYGLFGLEEIRTEKGEFKTVFNPAKKQIGYEEVPIREVTRELLGGETLAALGNSRTGTRASQMLRIALREGAAPITASAQQDVNAWSVYTGGLIELKFKEGFEKPEYIATKVVTSEPTATNGNRIIGEASMNLPDGPTQEAEEYPNQTVAPRWIFAPKRVKYGQKAALTREAIAFGLGGILLAEVQKGGEALAYLKEYLLAATVWGVNIAAGTPGFMAGYTTNTYQYDGTPGTAPNPTYQTAAVAAPSLYNYVNQITGQAGLNSWTDLQTARGYLSMMREPETNFPILTSLDEVVVQPFTEDTAMNVRSATSTFPTYGGGLSDGPTGSGATFAPQLQKNNNLRIWSSAIWQKVLLDSGVSLGNTNKYWLAGSIKRAFKWLSVWDERIVQANELSSSLVERDILSEWVYSWFGVPVVYEPRYVLLMTN